MADDQTLTEDAVVGGNPGGNHIEPKPGQTETIEVRPDQEYVSGRPYSWYLNVPHALPWAIDDISSDFGADVYERMLLDPAVRSVHNVLKSSILDDGIRLRPAVENEDDPGYSVSKQLLEDAELMFSDMERALDDVLWDLLDALALGYRIAEQVYELETTLSGKKQYTLRTLTPKPRQSLGMVVDPYMNILGFLARIPGISFGVQQGTLIAGLDKVPNILPRAKFAVLSHRPKNGDPRGTSILRPAFTPWNMKQQLVREYLKYLSQYATPSLMGFTHPAAQPVPLKNPDGSVQTDSNGFPILMTPEQAMVNALEDFHNGTVTAFPNGATVQEIAMTGEGRQFLEAFAHFNQQIAKTITNQTLATEEGIHQSGTASTTHKDILDTTALQLKRTPERTLERDVLRIWMLLNGRKADLRYCPRVRIGNVEAEDRTRMWGAWASLFAAGYIHPSQYAAGDQMMGLPPRTPSDEDGRVPFEQLRVQTDTEQPIDDLVGKSKAPGSTPGKAPGANATAGRQNQSKPSKAGPGEGTGAPQAAHGAAKGTGA